MVTIAAFYRFLALDAPATLREELRATFTATDLRGTMLLAPEGINGTTAASSETIEALLTFLADRTGLDRAEVKFSTADQPPFRRLKFKLKREIITFRNAAVDPTRPGQYVDPEAWNALLADPEVLLLDTRNSYETAIGTFAGPPPHPSTPSRTSPITSGKISTPQNIARSPCSAPEESDAKKLPPTCSSKASPRSTTSKAAS
jgi:UPF0176 protein